MSDFGVEFINIKSLPLMMSASGDGSRDDSTAFLFAKTLAGSRNATIWFPPGNYLLAGPASIDVPPNVTLKFANGAKLLLAAATPDSRFALTIRGAVDAGLWQIFLPPTQDPNNPFSTTNPYLSLVGRVVLKTRFLTAVYPEWWGVNQNPPVPLGTVPISDSSAAIQAAFDAAFNNLGDVASGIPPQPIPVHLSQTYFLSSPLTITAPPGAAGAFVVRGVQGMLSSGVGHPSLAANWNTTGTAYGFAS